MYWCISTSTLNGCLDYRLYPPDTTYGPTEYESVDYSESVTEQFDISKNNKIDLFFVVDDSCSMLDYQNNLSVNSFSLLNPLLVNESDFRIGVLAFTAPYQLEISQGYTFLTPGTPDTEVLLRDLLLVAPGSPTEKGRSAINGILTSSWHRTNVPLEIVVISDESDKTVWPSLSQFLTLADQLEQEKQNFRIHSIVVTNEDKPDGRPIGEDYIKLSKRYNGNIISIDDWNWEPTLKDISNSFVYYHQTEFYLSSLPETSTIQVQLVNEFVTIIVDDWIYKEDSNSIYSDFLLTQEKGLVKIEYKKR